MSRLKELREQASRKVAEARAALDGVTDATPADRVAELNQQFDRAMESYDRDIAQIEREERAARAEQSLTERREAEERAARDGRRPGGDVVAPGSQTPGSNGDVSIREAFKDLLIGDFGGLTPEARASLQKAGVAPMTPEMLKANPELRALTTGTGASGGYTVPTEFLPEIEKTMAIWGPMLNSDAIRLMPTDSGAPIEWPSIDDTAVRGEQFAENAEITDDAGVDPVFGQITLSAYMHNSEIVKVPIQLLADSAFNVESDLMPDLFGERMARTANDKLTTADGSSKPQGIAQGAANGKTAASISAIAPDELIDLQHSVNPAYRASPKAAFMFNDSTLAVLRKLKDSENRYIWQAPNLQTGEPGSLLGNRYWINPSMANIGANARSIIFGDLSKYVVRRVGNFTIFVFRERYMINLQLGFMAFGRFDGKVVNTAAIKRLTHPAS